MSGLTSHSSQNSTKDWLPDESVEIRRDQEEITRCFVIGPDQYCTPEKVTNNTVCGDSQYYCYPYENFEEYLRCLEEVGPDQYCTNKNTVCRLKESSNSRYFCRDYKIWSGNWKDYRQCEAQNATKYCSDPASNQNVCVGSHPKTASFLLFFFLLNYVSGLVSCIRLEERKWVPLITALCNFYPQYCKDIILIT